MSEAMPGADTNIPVPPVVQKRPYVPPSNDETQNLAAPPPTPQGKSMWDTQAFIIIPVLLIVLAVGFFMFLQFDLHTTSLHLLQNTSTVAPKATNNLSNSYSSGNSNPGNTVTTSASTTSIPNSNSDVNTSCYCMRNQQLEVISGSQVSSNVTVMDWKTVTSNPNNIFYSLPQQLKDSVTNSWNTYYIGNIIGNEYVYQSSNASGLYKSMPINVFGHPNQKNSTVNGFTYSYSNYSLQLSNNKTRDGITMVGYKGTYVVYAVFSLTTLNDSYRSTLSFLIANDISTTIGSSS